MCLLWNYICPVPTNAILVESLMPVNILLIPVGGNYTIDAKEAKEYVDRIMPDVVIPMHYKTKDCEFVRFDVGHFISDVRMVRVGYNLRSRAFLKQKRRVTKPSDFHFLLLFSSTVEPFHKFANFLRRVEQVRNGFVDVCRSDYIRDILRQIGFHKPFAFFEFGNAVSKVR